MGYQIDADGTIIRPGGEEEHALIVTSVTNGTISLSASSEKAGKTIYIYDRTMVMNSRDFIIPLNRGSRKFLENNIIN